MGNRNDRIDAHPGGIGGHPTHEVAVPFWHAQGSAFAMPCMIPDIPELPVGHLELFESDWLDYYGSPVVPKRVWYDVGAEDFNLAFNFNFTSMSSDGNVGYLTNLFDPPMAKSDTLIRLGPAWETGLFPSCQLWVISDNPDGRPFTVGSFGVGVQWRGHTLSLFSVNGGGSASFDMGSDPEPCFVRLLLGQRGQSLSYYSRASVWRIGDEEPARWMLEADVLRPLLRGPHQLYSLIILGDMYRTMEHDWTMARNEACLFALGIAENGEKWDPLTIQTMVVEHAAGSVELATNPATDMTVSAHRSTRRFAYHRDHEDCWGFHFAHPGDPDFELNALVEVQDDGVEAGTIAHGDKDLATWFFGVWGPYRSYFGEGVTSLATGTFPYPIFGTQLQGNMRAYDPYVRLDDGWWIFWSPCILGGVGLHGNPFTPHFDHWQSPGMTQHNTEGPHAMWKDSTWITIAIPSKYVTKFVFSFTLGLRTHQDFSMILGLPENLGVQYSVVFWTQEVDDQQEGPVDREWGLPEYRREWTTVSCEGTFTQEVPVHGKRFLRYGFRWESLDTLGQATQFGPRGGPLFGPPWIRAVCAPISRSIVMHWRATDPEKSSTGEEVDPTTTVIYAGRAPGMTTRTTRTPDPVQPGKFTESSESVSVEPYVPEHGWVEDVFEVKSVTVTVGVMPDGTVIPQGDITTDVQFEELLAGGMEAKKRNMRVFRLYRAAAAGTISAYSNGLRIVFGWEDPDVYNKKNEKAIRDGDLAAAKNDYWPVDPAKYDMGWDDAEEPRTYALRRGLRASAIMAHFLTTEYIQSGGEPSHRKSDASVQNVDRMRRGMIRGFS